MLISAPPSASMNNSYLKYMNFLYLSTYIYISRSISVSGSRHPSIETLNAENWEQRVHHGNRWSEVCTSEGTKRGLNGHFNLLGVCLRRGRSSQNGGLWGSYVDGNSGVANMLVFKTERKWEGE